MKWFCVGAAAFAFINGIAARLAGGSALEYDVLWCTFAVWTVGAAILFELSKWRKL